MKKNRDFDIGREPYVIRKIWLPMKLFCFFMLVVLTSVSARTHSQVKVSLILKDAKLTKVFEEISKLTGYDFVYSSNELKYCKDVSVDVENEELEKVLANCLRDTKLWYVIEDRIIVISPKVFRPQQEQSKSRKISGTIKDVNGKPVPGVTVVVKGTNIGVASDENGTFTFSALPMDKLILVFSFVGMKKQEVVVGSKNVVNVVMEEEMNEMDQVVINGYFTQKKNSYTGSVSSVKGDDLLVVSPNNILKALAFTVPGLHIIENNEQGSNPNAIPEIIIRGTTALPVNGEYGLNTPLIILDGVEITLEQLYDLDMQDIAQVDVLKDASAKAMYGEKAANGVILVTRKKVTDSKLRVRYNFMPDVQFPDVSSFNLCNGYEKLELERLCGVYDSPNGEKDELYWQRKNIIERGASTDWKSIPLRNSWSFDHSLNLTGRGGGMDYSLNFRYGDTRGVMKGDFRQKYGIGLSMSYHLKDILSVSYRLDISKTDTKDSPYGSFTDWVCRNPYEMPKDEYGDWVKSYNALLDRNPLYEASLESFNKTKTKTITNSINFRLDLLKGLYLNGAFNYSLSDQRMDHFISPESFYFLGDPVELQGSYEITGGEGDSWSTNATISYNLNLDEEGSLLSMNLGGTMDKNKAKSFGFQGVGFLKPILNDIDFSTRYAEGAPSGSEIINTSVGVFGNINFIWRNRYFIDGHQ